MARFTEKEKKDIRKALKKLNFRVRHYYVLEHYKGVWWFKNDYEIQTHYITIHSSGYITSNITGEVLNYDYKDDCLIPIMAYLHNYQHQIKEHITECILLALCEW